MAEGTIKNVGDNLKNVRENFENYGANFSFVGVFGGDRGKNVLNMFCYTGGFSVYAMRGAANLVHSVDVSAKAIELTRQNIELNFPNDARHDAFAEDAFKYLQRAGSDYDLIVLDPPAFAKHKDALRNALKGYTRLNAAAFAKIRPGGIVFTFSCACQRLR